MAGAIYETMLVCVRSVMVQVKSIAEMGAYVSLLEYNGIEGMILLSELSRRRIRSITKLIKVGASGTHRRGCLAWRGDREQSLTAARLSLLLTARPLSVFLLGWATRASHGAESGQGEGVHRSVEKVRELAADGRVPMIRPTRLSQKEI